MVPSTVGPLSINVHAALSNDGQNPPVRTVRKSVYEILPDGSKRASSQQEEYTFFDETVYVCSHCYSVEAAKKSDIFIWKGESSSEAAAEQAQIIAKRMSKEVGTATLSIVEQGYECPPFLQAIGGIFVTRRGSRLNASKQYMLCGRKHLGHIAFDEVDFKVASLCPGFVYLISYPVTLQQTKLFLWKGSACSAEEISAARLAAMDLNEAGEIIEVDNGAEFASFLKIFGDGMPRTNIPRASPFWQQKAQAPNLFETRLFRIQQCEQKSGLLANFFTRRPSWNSLSASRPSSRDHEEVKMEAKHIDPFTQADLEAEGVYVLDAFSEVLVLFGPLFPSQPDIIRNTLLGQALLFARAYRHVVSERRPIPVGANVMFRGLPSDMKMLFRHWDEGTGLWGTAGLMAGSQAQMGGEAGKICSLPLEDIVELVCRSQEG
ncbi:hypothetical protein M433DRAFT_63605 [Acidomyces richmondensis BFW]|nr:MAG: hypothetical protein FE78DRAFT_147814 [Acidomyces sp. 'richmondensis']KYG47190.1 hypothetical protein M433DRAFT_63605 [Acidomyces richmondensis BFW]